MENRKSLFLQPETKEELKELLPMLTEDSAVLAGGTDLMPGLRQSGREPDIYLSLWGIPDLKEITLEKEWLRIGAMVTHDRAAGDPKISRYFQALSMACQKVGSQQIRNKGTLCGSIANASPAGDIMPCVFLYGGELEITGPDGIKRVKAEDFLSESGKTRLDNKELITAIYLPVKDNLQSRFIKLGSRREVTIAQISLCISWEQTAAASENNVDLRAFVGAVDVRPVPFDGRKLWEAAAGDTEAAEHAARLLSQQIQDIRQRRKRESKLKLTEPEKLYKERAARGVIFDMVDVMGKIGGEK